MVFLAAYYCYHPPCVLSCPFLDTNGVHGWLYRALGLADCRLPVCAGDQHTGYHGQLANLLASRGVLVKGAGAYLDVLALPGYLRLTKPEH